MCVNIVSILAVCARALLLSVSFEQSARSVKNANNLYGADFAFRKIHFNALNSLSFSLFIAFLFLVISYVRYANCMGNERNAQKTVGEIIETIPRPPPDAHQELHSMPICMAALYSFCFPVTLCIRISFSRCIRACGSNKSLALLNVTHKCHRINDCAI